MQLLIEVYQKGGLEMTKKIADKQELLCKACKRPLTEFLETIHFNLCTPCFIKFMNLRFEKFEQSKKEHNSDHKENTHEKKRKQKETETQ